MGGVRARATHRELCVPASSVDHSVEQTEQIGAMLVAGEWVNEIPDDDLVIIAQLVGINPDSIPLASGPAAAGPAPSGTSTTAGGGPPVEGPR